MVASDHKIANLRERAAQKQELRARDAERVNAGHADLYQLRRENHVLSGVDLSGFRMVSVGKRRIGA